MPNLFQDPIDESVKLPESGNISLDDYIELLRKRNRIPKSIMRAWVQQESGGQDYKEGKPGEMLEGPETRHGRAGGRFQVLEKTARAYGLDRRDPYQNALAGITNLREGYEAASKKLKTEGERWAGALTYYHAGDTRLRQGLETGDIPRTSDGKITTDEYVQRIMDAAQKYSDEEPEPVTAVKGVNTKPEFVPSPTPAVTPPARRGLGQFAVPPKPTPGPAPYVAPQLPAGPAPPQAPHFSPEEEAIHAQQQAQIEQMKGRSHMPPNPRPRMKIKGELLRREPGAAVSVEYPQTASIIAPAEAPTVMEQLFGKGAFKGIPEAPKKRQLPVVEETAYRKAQLEAEVAKANQEAALRYEQERPANIFGYEVGGGLGNFLKNLGNYPRTLQRDWAQFRESAARMAPSAGGMDLPLGERMVARQLSRAPEQQKEYTQAVADAEKQKLAIEAQSALRAQADPSFGGGATRWGAETAAMLTEQIPAGAALGPMGVLGVTMASQDWYNKPWSSLGQSIAAPVSMAGSTLANPLKKAALEGTEGWLKRQAVSRGVEFGGGSLSEGLTAVPAMLPALAAGEITGEEYADQIVRNFAEGGLLQAAIGGGPGRSTSPLLRGGELGQTVGRDLTNYGARAMSPAEYSQLLRDAPELYHPTNKLVTLQAGNGQVIVQLTPQGGQMVRALQWGREPQMTDVTAAPRQRGEAMTKGERFGPQQPVAPPQARAQETKRRKGMEVEEPAIQEEKRIEYGKPVPEAETKLPEADREVMTPEQIEEEFAKLQPGYVPPVVAVLDRKPSKRGGGTQYHKQITRPGEELPETLETRKDYYEEPEIAGQKGFGKIADVGGHDVPYLKGRSQTPATGSFFLDPDVRAALGLNPFLKWITWKSAATPEQPVSSKADIEAGREAIKETQDAFRALFNRDLHEVSPAEYRNWMRDAGIAESDPAWQKFKAAVDPHFPADLPRRERAEFSGLTPEQYAQEQAEIKKSREAAGIVEQRGTDKETRVVADAFGERREPNAVSPELRRMATVRTPKGSGRNYGTSYSDPGDASIYLNESVASRGEVARIKAGDADMALIIARRAAADHLAKDPNRFESLDDGVARLMHDWGYHWDPGRPRDNKYQSNAFLNANDVTPDTYGEYVSNRGLGVTPATAEYAVKQGAAFNESRGEYKGHGSVGGYKNFELQERGLDPADMEAAANGDANAALRAANALTEWEKGRHSLDYGTYDDWLTMTAETMHKWGYHWDPGKEGSNKYESNLKLNEAIPAEKRGSSAYEGVRAFSQYAKDRTPAGELEAKQAAKRAREEFEPPREPSDITGVLADPELAEVATAKGLGVGPPRSPERLMPTVDTPISGEGLSKDLYDLAKEGDPDAALKIAATIADAGHAGRRGTRAEQIANQMASWGYHWDPLQSGPNKYVSNQLLIDQGIDSGWKAEEWYAQRQKQTAAEAPPTDAEQDLLNKLMNDEITVDEFTAQMDALRRPAVTAPRRTYNPAEPITDAQREARLRPAAHPFGESYHGDDLQRAIQTDTDILPRNVISLVRPNLNLVAYINGWRPDLATAIGDAIATFRRDVSVSLARTNRAAEQIRQILADPSAGPDGFNMFLNRLAEVVENSPRDATLEQMVETATKETIADVQQQDTTNVAPDTAGAGSAEEVRGGAEPAQAAEGQAIRPDITQAPTATQAPEGGAEGGEVAGQPSGAGDQAVSGVTDLEGMSDRELWDAHRTMEDITLAAAERGAAESDAERAARLDMRDELVARGIDPDEDLPSGTPEAAPTAEGMDDFTAGVVSDLQNRESGKARETGDAMEEVMQDVGDEFSVLQEQGLSAEDYDTAMTNILARMHAEPALGKAQLDNMMATYPPPKGSIFEGAAKGPVAERDARSKAFREAAEKITDADEAGEIEDTRALVAPAKAEKLLAVESKDKGFVRWLRQAQKTWTPLPLFNWKEAVENNQWGLLYKAAPRMYSLARRSNVDPSPRVWLSPRMQVALDNFREKPHPGQGYGENMSYTRARRVADELDYVSGQIWDHLTGPNAPADMDHIRATEILRPWVELATNLRKAAAYAESKSEASILLMHATKPDRTAFPRGHREVMEHETVHGWQRLWVALKPQDPGGGMGVSRRMSVNALFDPLAHKMQALLEERGYLEENMPLTPPNMLKAGQYHWIEGVAHLLGNDPTTLGFTHDEAHDWLKRRFDEIYDEYGDVVGEQALKALANRIWQSKDLVDAYTKERAQGTRPPTVDVAGGSGRIHQGPKTGPVPQLAPNARKGVGRPPPKEQARPRQQPGTGVLAAPIGIEDSEGETRVTRPAFPTATDLETSGVTRTEQQAPPPGPGGGPPQPPTWRSWAIQARNDVAQAFKDIGNLMKTAQVFNHLGNTLFWERNWQVVFGNRIMRRYEDFTGSLLDKMLTERFTGAHGPLERALEPATKAERKQARYDAAIAVAQRMRQRRTRGAGGGSTWYGSQQIPRAAGLKTFKKNPQATGVLGKAGEVVKAGFREPVTQMENALDLINEVPDSRSKEYHRLITNIQIRRSLQKVLWPQGTQPDPAIKEMIDAISDDKRLAGITDAIVGTMNVKPGQPFRDIKISRNNMRDLMTQAPLMFADPQTGGPSTAHFQVNTNPNGWTLMLTPQGEIMMKEWQRWREAQRLGDEEALDIAKYWAYRHANVASSILEGTKAAVSGVPKLFSPFAGGRQLRAILSEKTGAKNKYDAAVEHIVSSLGWGDLVGGVKYYKIPGGVLHHGFQRLSPVAMVDTIRHGRTWNRIRQDSSYSPVEELKARREFEAAFGRLMTSIPLQAAGYLLVSMGLIEEEYKGEKESVARMTRDVGRRPFAMNLSKAADFLTGNARAEAKTGDAYADFNLNMPYALPVILGAAVNFARLEAKKDVETTPQKVLNAAKNVAWRPAISIINTTLERTFGDRYMQDVVNALRYARGIEAQTGRLVETAAESLPSQFLPGKGLLNVIGNVTDPYMRERSYERIYPGTEKELAEKGWAPFGLTKHLNTAFYSQLFAGTPIGQFLLPPQLDPLGRPREKRPGTTWKERLFSSVAPIGITYETADKVQKEMMRVDEAPDYPQIKEGERRDHYNQRLKIRGQIILEEGEKMITGAKSVKTKGGGYKKYDDLEYTDKQKAWRDLFTRAGQKAQKQAGMIKEELTEEQVQKNVEEQIYQQEKRTGKPLTTAEKRKIELSYQ